MFMTESHEPRNTRDFAHKIGPSTIAMISASDLLAECITEVLSKNFADHEILRMRSVYDQRHAELMSSQLILLYRPSASDVLHIIDLFDENDMDASVGIVVESLDAAENLLRSLPENNVINGILPLDMRLDVFMATIQLLMKGGEHFPSALLQRLRRTSQPAILPNLDAERHTSPSTSLSRFASGAMALTAREIQILDLLCKGTQNKIIADRLRVSENTVKVHIRNIYKKMHVRNRTEAASRFFDMDRNGEG